jgi:predicted transcriptional regulator
MMRAQMNDMANQMEQTAALVQQLQQSYDMNKLKIDEANTQIKAFDAETKRIQATAANMTPEQIQEIVMGTIAAAMDTGDIVPLGMTPQRSVDEAQQELGL